MTTTRVVFVSTPAEAGPRRSDTTYVVLDTAWTPDRGSRADLQPVRPLVSAVVRRVDLFHAALDELDRWGARAGLVDGLVVDGVAWWFRVRPFLVDYLHERMLWSHVVAGLDKADLLEIRVPGGEVPLVDVLRSRAAAGGPAVVVAEGTTERDGGPLERVPFGARLLGRVRWWRQRDERRARLARQEHNVLLEDRVARLRDVPGAVLAITQPRIHQTVRTATGERRVDPQLAPILAGLEDVGFPVITIGLELDHRGERDWSMIRDDPTLLPQSLLGTRWNLAEDRDLPAAGVAEALEGASAVPCVVEGTDLAPALSRELDRYGGAWLTNQRLLARRVVRMIEELRPAGMLLNHEGIRTPWLAAAGRALLPVFAVQHGLIYPRHAVYSHPRHPNLPYPARTFTYGEYERRVLLEFGGYRPEEVVVAGSPRGAHPAAVDPAVRRQTRVAVCRRLGIDETARILVVSTAHTAIFRRYHLAHMLAELLAGPLPGVHVVFKLHPGETDEGPYRALVEGLARAAGHEPPPVTVVREIDLYELLAAADAHLGLHSTVLTDAVLAGTPNLLSTAEAYGDLLGYVDAGVATPIASAADLRLAMENPPRADPAARRAFLDDQFASGDAAANVALGIREALVSGASSGTEGT